MPNRRLLFVRPVLLLLTLVEACRPATRRDEASASPPGAPASDVATPGPAGVAPAAELPVAAAAVHGRAATLRAANELGVPLHPGEGDRKVSGRLPDGTRVVVLETARDGGWLRVRSDDGTDGWVVARYVQLDAPSAGAPAAVVPDGLPDDFPLPGGACPTAIPDPAAKLTAAAADDEAKVPGVESSRDGGRLVVVSYNVWELYDGRDGDDYLSDDHAEAERLAGPGHAARRVEVLGGALRAAAPHVLVLQEVEDAALACAVARAAVPDAGWRCWAAGWAREPHPQNVAVASRVGGEVARLDPGRGMGQRGALEWTLPGGDLRVAAVHLKSSVGDVGVEDCDNARKRMALAWGLAQRQAEVPGGAYLVIGDFNVDPADPLKVEYDRTDDILARAGGEDLVARLLASGDRPGGSSGSRTVIDRAVLRPGAGVEAVGLEFLAQAPRRGWASDHVPLVVELQVP
ncbi:MAG: SH3 domain-containing protein [Deltaproteobacteria bacterium]|nr:SH3 domain-containing protein [Deltaproteobacteria bacterium]